MTEPSLTLTGLVALDECRGRFEAAWKARPRIGDFLPAASADPGPRSRALRELLLLDIQYRRQRGETPSADDYLVELPGEADVVGEALASACAGTSQNDLGNASTIPLTDSPAGDLRLADWSASRFRILASHAKGGLGEVFLAEDLELAREVALKEIQAPFLEHASARRRFALEGAVTGQLEHPGIVPVYSLGVYADGRPFYAMRLIRGQSFSAAIRKFHAERERQPASAELELRQLLGRFVQVCNAVAYAHSRGVIHRDIKPANVMLGDFGETLLVDWGLAKRLGQEEVAPEAGGDTEATTNTQQGSWLGTPAYMSPEQAAGDVARIGPASDVYSLGATLYHLLTGKASIQGSDPDTLRERIRKGDFEPPRQVQSWISKPLEAICLTAMRVNQSDRYPSSQALAADIEHWLADEPVSCLAEPFVARARRWVKRHPALVVGTAATVLISLVSLGTIASIVGQSNLTLSKKNLELEAANQRERAATELAQKNEHTAEENAEVAREQSQLALKSLESVIFEIQTKLENVPGAGDLQRELLLTALARLEDVSDRFAARSAIDRNTAVALGHLGDVFLRIASGIVGGPDADGPLTAARKAYEQSFAIAQKLAAADPGDARAQRDLSISYERLGNVCLQAGEVAEALGHYQKCLEISRELVLDPTDTQAQRDLATLYGMLGDASLQAGLVTETLGYYQESLKISLHLTAADPADELARRILSSAYGRLGNVSLRAGQVAEALGHYQNSLLIGQQLADAHPMDVQLQRDLWVSYNALAQVSRRNGQVGEALGHYQRCLEIAQRLADADPADGQAQRDLSDSHNSLGDLILQSGQVNQALAHFQKSLALGQKLADADPSDAQAQRGLWVASVKLGTVCMQIGDVAQALGHYQHSLDISRNRAATDAADAQARHDVSLSCEKLGDVLLKQGQVAEALGHYVESREIRQALAAADPADVQALRDLWVSYIKLGDLPLQVGQVTEALAHYQKCLELGQQLAAADPSDAQAQRDLSVTFSKLGDVSLASDQSGLALDYYQQCLEIQESLAAADPMDARAQRDLSLSLQKLGSALKSLQEYERAIEAFRNALAILQSQQAQERLPQANAEWIGKIERLIQQCQLAATAVGDWETLLQQTTESLPALLEIRATQFVSEGRAADASQAVMKLRELGTATAVQLYNAACLYCLCATSIKNPDGNVTAELTPEQSAERQRYLDDALATLPEAIQAGFDDFAHMRQDPDLAVLRDLPEFKALLPGTEPNEP